MNFYPTSVLFILIGKGILDEKLKILFPQSHRLIKSFLLNIFYKKDFTISGSILNNIPKLLKWGLISEEYQNIMNRKSSLLFVEVINFELTYNCNYSCPHCLQSVIKKKSIVPLRTDFLKEIIYQAYIVGLCEKGINFTGGEVLGNRDDFFEVIEYAGSLEIPFRINTNCWWARRSDINVCNTRFKDSKELLIFLKSLGLYMLAFSFDLRYKESTTTAADLVESIRLCEELHIYYQVIFTGISYHMIELHIKKLSEQIGKDLEFIIPVPMEMVDVGGATELDSEVFLSQSNYSDCENKGYYRPTVLHISPNGDVRTCLYAVGLQNGGNLNSNALVDLINLFHSNNNNIIFESKSIKDEKYKSYVEPYLKMYKPIFHECTKNIILAKTLEKLNVSKNAGLESIHRNIAIELNLNN